ncbi:MAG: ATP-dependent DNA helicase Rep [Alphaproteobacteria bacterium MarineAlpha6_Bin2]|nr:MAG: ATP-dependent DNA helicase Rep [Alphaproteobacteria bacterium MarineAlpha6_Bin2]
MGIRTIIPGPPGTGKTFRLVNHYLEKEINEYKTDPQKIIYITYSNAGIDDVKIKHNLLYISTMHSLGTRELKINTSKRLLNGKRKWEIFKTYPNHEAYRNMSFETIVDAAGNPKYENNHMRIIQYARSKKIDLEQAAFELSLEHEEIDFTHQLNQDLKTFKEHTKMIEFHDMIELFEKKDRMNNPDSLISGVEAVFLDEAQDLSPSQFDMFFYIEKNCKRSYIAGDDDQTIYTFQGADPNIFINLQGKFDNQIQSHRVPRKIHAKALEVLRQIDNRLDKSWDARKAEGELFEHYHLDNIDFTEKNWMVLAMTNKLLDEIEKHFFRVGIRFKRKGNKILTNDILKSYQTWILLQKGDSVKEKDAKTMYKEFIRYKDGHVAHGFSSGDSLEGIEYVSLNDLKKDHGLLASGSWEQFKIDEDTKNYIKTLLKKGDDLMSNTKIELSTMHGSKGRECENVVLFMDYGTENQWLFLRDAERNPDAQHRLIFVGITRAKQRLYIMAPLTDKYYTIGEPIV